MMELQHLVFFKFPELKILCVRHKMNFLLILVMLLLSLSVSIYKTQKFIKYTEIENTMQPVIDIITDDEKMKFIQQHKFTSKCVKITDFIKKTACETYAKVTNLEKISEEKLGKICIKQVKLTGFFWHDVFILDFLEKIQNFSPGFINIISIEINKFSKKVMHKPIMKLEMVCRIFQKL